MNTKELFELAKIASDTEDLFLQHDHEDYKIAEWEDQHPHEQAAKAEAIRAVIEELKNRGWIKPGTANWIGPKPEYPFVPYVDEDVLKDQPVNLVQAINDANLTAYEMAQVTAIPEQVEKREPRVWERIQDVPANTVVEDNDHEGDFYRWSDGHLEYRYSDSGWGVWCNPVEEANDYGPFTEIADTWDRWEDVPENVWAESVPNGARYISRNGVRYVGWDDGTDEKHQSSTEWLNTYRAPFKRVG